MRIDKFLNTTNILKNRATAQDMIENRLVCVNSLPVKPSNLVKIGDIIEVRFLEYAKKYEILAIPATKSIKKSEKSLYVREII